MLQARAGASVQAHGQESTMSHAQHRRGAGPCWAPRARSSPAPRAAVVGEGARVDGRGKRVCARHRPRVPPRRAMPVRAPVGSAARRARARTTSRPIQNRARARASWRARASLRAQHCRAPADAYLAGALPFMSGRPMVCGVVRAACGVRCATPRALVLLSLSLSLSSARARGARTRVPARAVGSRWPHTPRGCVSAEDFRTRRSHWQI